jgi:2-keto-4-pentenoate hydratase
VYGWIVAGGLVDVDVTGVGSISVGEWNLFCVEAEVGFIMGTDLPPTADNAPRTEAEVYAAVESVAVCIECVGRRYATPDAAPLQAAADGLSGAGVIIGKRV